MAAVVAGGSNRSVGARDGSGSFISPACHR